MSRTGLLQLLAISIIVLLGGCSSAPSESAIQTAIAATAEAQPTATQTPTITPSPRPTATWTPEPTFTPRPTFTRRPTATPDASAQYVDWWADSYAQYDVATDEYSRLWSLGTVKAVTGSAEEELQQLADLFVTLSDLVADAASQQPPDRLTEVHELYVDMLSHAQSTVGASLVAIAYLNDGDQDAFKTYGAAVMTELEDLLKAQDDFQEALDGLQQ